MELRKESLAQRPSENKTRQSVTQRLDVNTVTAAALASRAELRMSASEVREAARGHWPAILVGLGIPAEALTGKHGPCPGCGGRDRFRFDDREGRGTWICGGGGETRSGDGFALLEHVHGWDFPRALAEVARWLRIEPDQAPVVPRSKLGTQAELWAAILGELYVLIITLENRVMGRAIANAPAFRYLHPEYRPMPPEPWERELQAARRLPRLLPEAYPELNGEAAE